MPLKYNSGVPCPSMSRQRSSGSGAHLISSPVESCRSFPPRCQRLLCLDQINHRKKNGTRQILRHEIFERECEVMVA